MTKRLGLLVTLSALVGSVSASERSWPSFRGTGSGSTTAENLPLQWSEQSNIAWKFDIKGYGQSSPVVWEDRIYVTSVAGPDKGELFVTCVDLKTGKQLWIKQFEGTLKIPDTDYVSKGAPTPVADAEGVYAFFESGDLIALTAAGETRWQQSLIKEYGPFKGAHGLGSSPAATKTSIVILVAQSEKPYLLAVDKKTGAKLWKVDADFGSSWSSPIVVERDGKSLILLSTGGTVDAYDAKDGARLWQVTGVDGNTVPSPAPYGDLVVVGSKDKGSNLAIKLGGQGDVTTSHVAWHNNDATVSFGSPIAHGDQAYFVNRPGVVFGVDLKTGKTLWNHRLPDSCWASPIGVGDRVYFFAKNGKTVVLQSGPELKVLAENDLPTTDKVYGVAAVDGAFIIRTGSQLIRVGSP